MDMTTLGFPASFAKSTPYPLFPTITMGTGDAQSLGGGNTPSRRYINQFNPEANVHSIYGRHALKYGANFIGVQDNNFSSARSGGSFTFNRSFTQGPDPTVSNSLAGYDVASFVLGMPGSGFVDFNAVPATIGQIFRALRAGRLEGERPADLEPRAADRARRTDHGKVQSRKFRIRPECRQSASRQGGRQLHGQYASPAQAVERDPVDAVQRDGRPGLPRSKQCAERISGRPVALLRAALRVRVPHLEPDRLAGRLRTLHRAEQQFQLPDQRLQPADSDGHLAGQQPDPVQ